MFELFILQETPVTIWAMAMDSTLHAASCSFFSGTSWCTGRIELLPSWFRCNFFLTRQIACGRAAGMSIIPTHLTDENADNKNGGKYITFFPFASFKHLALFYWIQFAVLNSRGVGPNMAQTACTRRGTTGGSLAHRLLTQGHHLFLGVTIVRTEKCPTIPEAQVWNLRPQGVMPLWATSLP